MNTAKLHHAATSPHRDHQYRRSTAGGAGGIGSSAMVSSPSTSSSTSCDMSTSLSSSSSDADDSFSSRLNAYMASKSPPTSAYSSKQSSRQSSPTRRARRHRRYLNKLAILLPRLLKPLASSVPRLIGTFAAALFLLLLCLSMMSGDANSSPAIAIPAVLDTAARATEKLGSLVKRAEQYPLMAQDDEQAVIGDDLGVHDEDEESEKEVDEVLQRSDRRRRGDDKPAKGAHCKECTSCGTRGCDPEGYPKGVDMLASGAPTPYFRDNLLKDKKYLTFGMMNGFSSQFLAVANGIYLSKLADRVPVIPPFAASPGMDRHAAGYLGFNKIFDIPRLESLIRHPVQDWQNVKVAAEQVASINEQVDNEQFKDESLRKKKLNSVKREKISCWSLWAAQMPSTGGKPAGSAVQHHLGLDIEYWQAPLHYSHPPHDRHIRYWDLVLLDNDIDNAKSKQLSLVAKNKREALSDNRKKPLKNAELPLPPDDQLLCYDTLFYTAATGPMEWWQPHAPVWKAVGRYAHWHPDIDALTDTYLRYLLETDVGVIPDFISVHIRRGDFKKACKDLSKPESCYPPLELYKASINKVRDELLDRKGSYTKNVIVTTDEVEDDIFLAHLEHVGWRVVNHKKMNTVQSYGSIWWPVVLDAAIQSKGSAFVGTDKSVMSLLAAKRVEEWNNGPWKLVKWTPPK